MQISTSSNQTMGLSGKNKEIAAFIISMTCMFLFLFSGYEKLVTHDQFLAGLLNVEVLKPHAQLISWIVPLSEILTSILLVIPKTNRKGLVAFMTLMAIFTVYIISMWIWAEKLPCRCNLMIEKLSWRDHILFNLIFIGLALLGLRLNKTNFKT